MSPTNLSTTYDGGFTLFHFVAERQAGELQIPIFIIFCLTPPEIDPEYTVSLADALFTRPLISKVGYCHEVFGYRLRCCCIVKI